MIPYALFNSKIVFEPFQYKPFFEFFEHTDRDLYIADEVGVGKTIEAGIIISELIFGDRKNSWVQESLNHVHFPKILILSPTALCSQWKEELESKFMLRVYDAYTTRLGINRNAPITVFAESWQQLKKIEDEDTYYDLLIVDEAHNFRNKYIENPFTQEKTDSRRYESLRKICARAKRKIFMSATPIFNRTTDFKNEIDLLSKDFSITASTKAISKCLDFQPRIESVLVQLNPAERNLYSSIDSEDIINPLTKSAVYLHEGCSSMPCLARTLLDGPVKYIKNAFKEQEISNADDDQELMQIIIDACENKDYASLEKIRKDMYGTGIWSILTIVLEKESLKKYAEIYESEKNRYDDSKLVALDMVINQKLSKKNGYSMTKKHVVIFAHYIATCEYIFEHFRNSYSDEIKLFLATGDNTKEEIDRSIEEFKKTCLDDTTDSVMICSDVCREGKNMQECQVIINYDLPFSPSIMQQRIGRIDRNGQQHTPLVFNLLCDVYNDIHTYYEIIFAKIRLINGTSGICGIDVIRETNKEVQKQVLNEWVQAAEKSQKEYHNNNSALQNGYLKYLRSEKDRLKTTDTRAEYINSEIKNAENYTDDDIKNRMFHILFTTPNDELKSIREAAHCQGKMETALKLFGSNYNADNSVREYLIAHIHDKLRHFSGKHLLTYIPEKDTFLLDISEIKKIFIRQIHDKQYFEQFSNMETDANELRASDMYFDEMEIAFGTAVYKEVGSKSDINGKSLSEFEQLIGESFENCFIPLDPLCDVLAGCM